MNNVIFLPLKFEIRRGIERRVGTREGVYVDNSGESCGRGLKLKSFSRGGGKGGKLSSSVDKCINANLGDTEVGMRIGQEF